jgi:hypothetical protein
VKVGTRVVVLPGQPPARDSSAPVSGMPPGRSSPQIAPPQSLPSAMSR